MNVVRVIDVRTKVVGTQIVKNNIVAAKVITPKFVGRNVYEQKL